MHKSPSSARYSGLLGLQGACQFPYSYFVYNRLLNSEVIVESREDGGPWIVALKKPSPSKSRDRNTYAKSHAQIVKLKEALEKESLTYIDKTVAGGCLWVLDFPNSKEFLQALSPPNYAWSYASNGSKATQNKPAWYLKTVE